MNDTGQGFEERLSAGLHGWSEGVTPSEGFVDRVHVAVDGRRRRRRLFSVAVAVAVAAVVAGGVELGEVLAMGGAASFSSDSSAPASGGASGGSTRPTPVYGSMGGGSRARAGAGPAAAVPGPASGAASPTVAPSAPPGNGPAAPIVPSGWIPIDVASARISVPPGSFVSGSNCPEADAPVTVFLRGANAAPSAFLCTVPSSGSTTVSMSVLPRGSSTAGLPTSTVNGVTVFRSGAVGSTGTLLVPSLGVQLQASGPDTAFVLGTLARSPRVAVLARGRWPRVPRSWRHRTLGGLRVAVPPNWPVRHLAYWGPVCQDVAAWDQPGFPAGPSSATLVSGTLQPTANCPMIAAAPSQAATAPEDGIVVDPGPVGPVSPSATAGPCPSIPGLRVCVDNDYPYGQLVLEARLPNGRRVAVDIGLGGSGSTARTILGSLRPA